MKNVRREDWETLQPTVYGWGINDVNYKVTKNTTIGYHSKGKRIRKMEWTCPYYQDWSKMIQRCFDKKYLDKHPSYIGVQVCQDWRYLSNFISWVDSQPNTEWENCDLDKDLVLKGSRLYSPETCVYLDQSLNQFLTNYKERGGSRLVGAYYVPHNNKNMPYMSQLRSPFTGKIEYLGAYYTELEAHLAWKAKKHEYALKLAATQTDVRITESLKVFYL